MLTSPGNFAALGSKARATIRTGYSFERNTLPQFQELIEELAPDIGQLMISGCDMRPSTDKITRKEIDHAPL